MYFFFQLRHLKFSSNFFYSKSTENLRAESLSLRATNLAKLLLVNMFISQGVKSKIC